MVMWPLSDRALSVEGGYKDRDEDFYSDALNRGMRRDPALRLRRGDPAFRLRRDDPAFRLRRDDPAFRLKREEDFVLSRELRGDPAFRLKKRASSWSPRD